MLYRGNIYFIEGDNKRRVIRKGGSPSLFHFLSGYSSPLSARLASEQPRDDILSFAVCTLTTSRKHKNADSFKAAPGIAVAEAVAQRGKVRPKLFFLQPYPHHRSSSFSPVFYVIDLL